MMNIQKLSETEKDLAISEIIRRGVISPRDKLGKMLEVRRTCTFHTLFFGVGDCLFIGLIAAVCVWMFLIHSGSQVIVCMIFAASPIAYIAAYLLTAWKERLLQLYDIKMTCRYTLRQIFAIRMVYFSGINILLNVLILFLFMRYWFSAVAFWKVMGLSFTAVFLYGAITLCVQIKGKPYLSTILPPVLWGTISVLVTALYGEELEKMLLNLAGSLVLIITVAVLVIYLIAMFAFFISRNKGEDNYAVS